MNELPHKVPLTVMMALLPAAERYSVPIRLLVGVAWVESRFSSSSSRGDAQGIFRLTTATARAFGATDPFDMFHASDVAAKILAMMREKFGAWERVLAAWNWGVQNVELRPEPEQWPPHVRAYVRAVHEAGQAAAVPFGGKVIQIPMGVFG